MGSASDAVEIILGNDWERGNNHFSHPHTNYMLRLNPEEKSYEGEGYTDSISYEVGAAITQAGEILEDIYGYTGTLYEVEV